MILFIAPNPHKEPNREGFLQRVAAIDGILADKPSVYYWDIDGIEAQAEALAKADVIYAHSIYSAKRILITYPALADKIITDLHGVVPEEEQFAGDSERAEILSKVESEVFQHGKYFVAVSEAMVRHFKRKYPSSKKANWVVLPIFESTAIVEKKKLSATRNVVYAGGTQKWQNVDLMVEVVNQSSAEYSYTFLTHNPKSFGGIDAAHRDNVIIRSVKSTEVGKYYKSATFGFILRDEMVINEVSCPTKLIEYLSHDVVPIVLNPSIGDVEQLGYGYVTLEQLKEESITDDQIWQEIKKNRQTLALLKSQTKTGSSALRSNVKMLTQSTTQSVAKSALRSYLELNASYEESVHALWKANAELGRLRYELDMQEQIIHDHKRRLRFVRDNPIYRIAKKLRLFKAI